MAAIPPHRAACGVPDTARTTAATPLLPPPRSRLTARIDSGGRGAADRGNTGSVLLAGSIVEQR